MAGTWWKSSQINWTCDRHCQWWLTGLTVWAVHHILCSNANSEAGRHYRAAINWLINDPAESLEFSLILLLSRVSMSEPHVWWAIFMNGERRGCALVTIQSLDTLPDQHDWRLQSANGACWVCNLRVALQAASGRSIQLWHHPEIVHSAEAAGYLG